MTQSKKNVLYISYDGMTDPLGQSQVLPYLKGLSNEYNVHLISFEKIDRFEQFKHVIEHICDEADIRWCPEMYTKKPPVLSTVYDIYKLFGQAKKIINEHNIQLIHCRSYISAFVGLHYKRKQGIKFLFDMRGFWADERIDGGIWSLKNPVFKTIYNFFKKKEKDFFQDADAIVSLTENGKAEILSWQLPNVSDSKINVIPCCVDLNLFDKNSIDSNQKNELKQQLNIVEQDFVLGYVGSIGTWYMLPEMLDYFIELKKEKPTAKFLFVTAENPEIIITATTEKGISAVDIIVTKCLHKEVPTFISLFDWSIFFIRPTYSKKASSPTKQGELMAMGIPVVCNTGVGDSDYVIENYKSGLLVQSFNQNEYQKVVREMNDFVVKPDEFKTGASNFFGLENGIQTYLSIYKKLIND